MMALNAKIENATVMALNAKTEDVTLNVKLGSDDDDSERRN